LARARIKVVENESYRMSIENNHYQLLDISPNASMEEIKEAYHKLAFRYHPDRNQMSLTSNKIMEKITRLIPRFLTLLSEGIMTSRWGMVP
jgi:preprotein translocase subunit Sec63